GSRIRNRDVGIRLRCRTALGGNLAADKSAWAGGIAFGPETGSPLRRKQVTRGSALATPMLCRKAFFICAVPRSGSSLLCNLLQRTGVAGNPMEYGGEEDERTWRRGHGFSDHRNYFLHFVHRLSVTGNGVFSAKLMIEHMISFAADV